MVLICKHVIFSGEISVFANTIISEANNTQTRLAGERVRGRLMAMACHENTISCNSLQTFQIAYDESVRNAFQSICCSWVSIETFTSFFISLPLFSIVNKSSKCLHQFQIDMQTDASAFGTSWISNTFKCLQYHQFHITSCHVFADKSK